jgi:hypothetical protein
MTKTQLQTINTLKQQAVSGERNMDSLVARYDRSFGITLPERKLLGSLYISIIKQAEELDYIYKRWHNIETYPTR